MQVSRSSGPGCTYQQAGMRSVSTRGGCTWRESIQATQSAMCFIWARRSTGSMASHTQRGASAGGGGAALAVAGGVGR
ncbi:hypothetical protein DQ384_39290 [Sphaerisporangium album]|uniref:Uncharacterized protein n=1 Tax=Sphaerisporangium album TaxID=509200 RepID=A0A367EKE7_9ACTN|nr:hypothetical protein DQ384_39290 [Sphaerisporangium album]